jgi:hypothetical protein
MSPDLPPSALKVLEEARETFAEKPLKVSVVHKLGPAHVRRALATARRKAHNDQVPAVIYSPKGGEALVIVPVEELASLLARAVCRLILRGAGVGQELGKGWARVGQEQSPLALERSVA